MSILQLRDQVTGKFTPVPCLVGPAGKDGNDGANGLSIYKSSENNIEEANYKILFSKITNYGRDIQVGDIIILNDLNKTLVIVQEINQDSVTVQKTLIELQGKDGSNGNNGTGIFTGRRDIGPEGYYEASSIDYPIGREPIIGDLIIFNDYGLGRITAVNSIYEITIENISMNIKGVT